MWRRGIFSLKVLIEILGIWDFCCDVKTHLPLGLWHDLWDPLKRFISPTKTRTSLIVSDVCDYCHLRSVPVHTPTDRPLTVSMTDSFNTLRPLLFTDDRGNTVNPLRKPTSFVSECVQLSPSLSNNLLLTLVRVNGLGVLLGLLGTGVESPLNVCVRSLLSSWTTIRELVGWMESQRGIYV